MGLLFIHCFSERSHTEFLTFLFSFQNHHIAHYTQIKISSFDPFGHLVTSSFAPYLEKGFDIRPTIAVTRAHIDLPECRDAVRTGRLVADGTVLMPKGQSIVSKAAIEPVWYLPEVARRFGCTEKKLRESVFQMTNGMYPELITRPDIKVFLPPIGGMTVYIWGDVNTIPNEDIGESLVLYSPFDRSR